jgi:hypothetical protein
MVATTAALGFLVLLMLSGCEMLAMSATLDVLLLLMLRGLAATFSGSPRLHETQRNVPGFLRVCSSRVGARTHFVGLAPCTCTPGSSPARIYANSSHTGISTPQRNTILNSSINAHILVSYLTALLCSLKVYTLKIKFAMLNSPHETTVL